MDNEDKITGGILGAWGIVVLAVAAACVFGGGCTYKGAKVTEGTDLAIGLNVPVSEGTLQLQCLNYLSGFRLGVDRNAILKVRYTVAETNSYLGCVTTRTAKTVDATVEPCESDAANSDLVEHSEAAKAE